MKTTILMTIEHSKPIPDLTDIAANRVWPLDGVTGVTAAIQDLRTGSPPGLLQDDDRKLSKALAATPDARRLAEQNAVSMHVARLACATYGVLDEKKKPGFWSWLWRTQA